MDLTIGMRQALLRVITLSVLAAYGVVQATLPLITEELQMIHGRPLQTTRHLVEPPTWLTEQLSPIQRMNGANQFYINLYTLCESSGQTLGVCYNYRKHFSELVNGLIYGAILLRWLPDLDQLFQPFTRAIVESRATLFAGQAQIAESTPHVLLETFFEQTWEKLRDEIDLYVGHERTHDIPYVVSIHSDTRGYLKKSELLKRWWSAYPALIQAAHELYNTYHKWSEDLTVWRTYLQEFDDVNQTTFSEQSSSPTSLIEKTDALLDMMRDSPYFDYDQYVTQIGNAPFFVSVPKVLATGCPAKTIRLFCLEHNCDQFTTLRNQLFTIDYVTHPELMRNLAHIITEEDRWNEIKETAGAQEQRDTFLIDQYQYATELPPACLQSDVSLKFCDICGIYQPTIYFFISQSMILDLYKDDLPYLWDMEAPTDFDVAEFNSHLIKLYNSVRLFFGLSQDVYLSYWIMKDWSYDVTELYQLFRGYNEIWQIRPPTGLINNNNLVNVALDLTVHGLQFFWARVLRLFRDYRDIWWVRILEIARKYDDWLVSQHLSPHLYESCGSLTLFKAIQLLTTTALDIQVVSRNKVQIPNEIQVALTRPSGVLKGTISVVEEAFDACSVSWLKRHKGMKFSLNKKSRSPPLPRVPDKDAILRNNKMTRYSSHVHQNSFLDQAGTSRSHTRNESLGKRLKKKISQKFIKERTVSS